MSLIIKKRVSVRKLIIWDFVSSNRFSWRILSPCSLVHICFPPIIRYWLLKLRFISFTSWLCSAIDLDVVGRSRSPILGSLENSTGAASNTLCKYIFVLERNCQWVQPSIGPVFWSVWTSSTTYHLWILFFVGHGLRNYAFDSSDTLRVCPDF